MCWYLWNFRDMRISWKTDTIRENCCGLEISDAEETQRHLSSKSRGFLKALPPLSLEAFWPRHLPEGNLELSMPWSTLSQGKTLVISLIRHLIFVVQSKLVSPEVLTEGSVLLLICHGYKNCLLRSGRIAAWVDENTLWPPLWAVQTLGYCSALTLFHISGGNAWHLKGPSYYPNIGTSYKPDKGFVGRRCAGVRAEHQSQNEITF